jgi:prefoldin subunit 5
MKIRVHRATPAEDLIQKENTYTEAGVFGALRQDLKIVDNELDKINEKTKEDYQQQIDFLMKRIERIENDTSLDHSKRIKDLEMRMELGSDHNKRLISLEMLMELGSDHNKRITALEKATIETPNDHNKRIMSLEKSIETLTARMGDLETTVSKIVKSLEIVELGNADINNFANRLIKNIDMAKMNTEDLNSIALKLDRLGRAAVGHTTKLDTDAVAQNAAVTGSQLDEDYESSFDF